MQLFREILENEISVHRNFPDQLAGTSIPAEKCFNQDIIEVLDNTLKQFQGGSKTATIYPNPNPYIATCKIW